MAFWHIPWGYFATSCIHFQSEIVFFYCTPWHMFHRDQRAIEKTSSNRQVCETSLSCYLAKLQKQVFGMMYLQFISMRLGTSSRLCLRNELRRLFCMCVLIHIIGPNLVLCSDTWQSELFNGVAAGSFFQFFRGKNFGFRVRLYGGKKVALLRILLYPISKSTNSKHWM